jgi:hypothetical protein
MIKRCKICKIELKEGDYKAGVWLKGKPKLYFCSLRHGNKWIEENLK